MRTSLRRIELISVILLRGIAEGAFRRNHSPQRARGYTEETFTGVERLIAKVAKEDGARVAKNILQGPLRAAF
jgi:hypothetical protein